MVNEANLMFYLHHSENEMAKGRRPDDQLRDSLRRFTDERRELQSRLNELIADDTDVNIRYDHYRSLLNEQVELAEEDFQNTISDIMKRYADGLIDYDQQLSLVYEASSKRFEARVILGEQFIPGYQLPGATLGQFQAAQISINEYINNNDPQNILETSDVLEQVFESEIATKSVVVDGEIKEVLDESQTLENSLEQSIAVAREQLGDVEFAFVIVDDFGGGNNQSTFVAVEMSEFQEAVGGGDGGDTGTSEDSGGGDGCPM